MFHTDENEEKASEKISFYIVEAVLGARPRR